MEKIQIQQLGIDGNSVKREINRNIKNPFDAFNEYIWNSIDAGAKNIQIKIKADSKYIKELSIIDDGCGIDYDELNASLFGKFNTSQKAAQRNKNLSLPHGEKGFGRFAFIKFANDVSWETVYKDGSNKFQYSIKINKTSLDNYKLSVLEKTTRTVGTETIFNFESMKECEALTSNNKEDILDKLKESIALEFCWVIELLDINVKINNQPLDYELYKEPTVKDKFEINHEKFKIKFIKWKQQLKNQSSRYYLINSKGKEVFVETTTLNNKGDDFYHSIYVKSIYFDSFHVLKNRGENTFSELIKLIDTYLKRKRKPYIDQFANNKFQRFEKEKILPKFSKFEEQVKKPIFEKAVKEVISFAPSLVSSKTNNSQVKILLELINRLLDDDKSRDILYDILSVLLDNENKEYLEELKRLLDNYGLKNILGTIQLIERRKETIERLMKMIYDENKYYLESDLQKEIEESFWIFGEEYNLMIGAEEDDFNKLRKIYCENVLKLKPQEYENDKLSKRQVDLFICAQTEEGRCNKHLIVEIKKPSLNLTKDHYRQIEDYKDEINKIPEFNTEGRHCWNFILLYKDISKVHLKHFEEKIADKFTGKTVDSSKNTQIFVIKWADLLEEIRYRLKFVLEKLDAKKKNLIPKTKVTSQLHNFVEKTKKTSPHY